MTATELAEALEAVQNINLAAFDQEVADSFITLEMDGFVAAIQFNHERIWYSDEDQREFLEDKNAYEPLEPWLRRILEKKIKQLSTLTLL